MAGGDVSGWDSRARQVSQRYNRVLKDLGRTSGPPLSGSLVVKLVHVYMLARMRCLAHHLA